MRSGRPASTTGVDERTENASLTSRPDTTGTGVPAPSRSPPAARADDLGDEPDVIGAGAAAATHDVAAGVEQRRVVLRHRLGPELVGGLATGGDGQSRVRVGDERGVGDR